MYPWLPEAGLVMIHASTGIGKTLFALSAAWAISTGKPFLRFTSQEAQSVLYLDGEMPQYLMKLRMAEAHRLAGSPEQSKFRIYCWASTEDSAPDLSTAEGQALVDAVIGDAQVIFIDNLSAFCRTGKENEAESWQITDAWLLKHRRAGRAIVLIHHDGKNGFQRGTSKREDKLDTVIQLVPPSIPDKSLTAHFEVHFKKKRHFWGKDAEPFEAILKAEGWAISEIKDAQYAEARAMKSDGKSYRDIQKATGIPKSTLNRHLGGEA